MKGGKNRRTEKGEKMGGKGIEKEGKEGKKENEGKEGKCVCD